MENKLSNIYSRQLLIFSAFVIIIVFFALRTFDASLHTSSAPSGILSFEFAKNIYTAEQIVASWNSEARINAGLSLGIDYLFLIVYSLFFSISIYFISNKFIVRFSVLRKIGLTLSALIFFAGLFDAVENYALIHLLLGSGNTIYPPIAYYFAFMKFLIIAIGLVYIMIGLLLGLMIKTKNGR